MPMVRDRRGQWHWSPDEEGEGDTVCKCGVPLRPLLLGSACARCNRVVMEALPQSTLDRAEQMRQERLTKRQREE